MGDRKRRAGGGFVIPINTNSKHTEPRNAEKRTRVLDRDYEQAKARELRQGAVPKGNVREAREALHKFIAFNQPFAVSLLTNIKILMIGDSLMRGMYKDLITLVTTGELSADMDLKAKSEASCMGDRQIDLSLLDADKVFRQAREFVTEEHNIQFFFTTRVMKDDMGAVLKQMLREDECPDVILINSMIWDLTRYFKVQESESYLSTSYQKTIEMDSIQTYLDRASMLVRRLRAILPPHTMVVWVCFPHCRPSTNGRGIQNAPLTKERNYLIRSVMIDGNFKIAQLFKNAGYDVLDIEFFMRNHAFYNYQKDDGMHWWPSATRLMTQLVLQFLARSWGIDVNASLLKLKERQRPGDLRDARDLISMYGHFKNCSANHRRLAEEMFTQCDDQTKHWISCVVEQGRTIGGFCMQPRVIHRVSFTGRRSFPMKTALLNKPDLEDVEEMMRELKFTSDEI